MRVQRFATLADIDASHPTVEEREEYEEPVRMGMVMYAGVDYEAILRQAEKEADVVIWDGGNNDFPFFAPDLLIVVADPLRPGHELLYHPGETNLRMADVGRDQQGRLAPRRTTSRRCVDERRGGQPDGDGRSSRSRRRCSTTAPTCAASASSSSTTARRSPTAGCRSAPGSSPPRTPARPRSSTRGRTRSARCKDVFAKWPQLTNVLPAMGYSDEQLAELEADDQRGRLRRRRHRHADRPRPADRVAPPDPARALRARGGRDADARRRPRTHHATALTSPRCPSAGPAAVLRHRLAVVAAWLAVLGVGIWSAANTSSTC